MKVLIVTPLYPPDIAGPAPYVKELAKRLSPSHEVTILAYGHLPEEVAGVRIVTIEKRDPGHIRLIRFTRALLRLMKQADVILLENGPSVELPLFWARILHSSKVILHLYDENALAHAVRSLWHRFLLNLAVLSADRVIAHSTESPATTRLISLKQGFVRDIPRPLPRPEILPFAPRVESDWNEYEASWVLHQEALHTIMMTL